MKPNPNPYQPFLLLPLTHTLFTPLTLPSHSFYSSYTSSTLSLSLFFLPSLSFPHFFTSFYTLLKLLLPFTSFTPLSPLFHFSSLPLPFTLHSFLSSLSTLLSFTFYSPLPSFLSLTSHTSLSLLSHFLSVLKLHLSNFLPF